MTIRYSTITRNIINHVFTTHDLSEREQQVFMLLLQGLNNDEMAQDLDTTKHQISAIAHEIISKKMGFDGGRVAFWCWMFETIDSEVMAEDRLIEEYKKGRE